MTRPGRTPGSTEVRSYTPLPSQRRFHESNAFLRAFIGGFGSGKTLAGVWEAIDVSMAYPRNVGVIARKTYRELADSTKKVFFDVCPPELIRGFRARDDTLTFINDSVVIFRSLDDIDKFRSLNLGWFYVDEASEIDDESVPTMLIGRLRLPTVPWRGGWFTSNPSHVEHWLYKWFVERAAQYPNRYFLVRASSYDNPHLPAEYVETLEREYSPQWVRRYLQGEFSFLAAGSPVYANFVASDHVVDDLEWLPDRPVFRAWDFGWHHPAVLFSQIGRDGVLNVLYETMGTAILLHRFAEEVIRISNDRFPGSSFVDVGDPAGNQRGDKDPRTSIEILRSVGIKVQTRRHPKKRLIELVDQRLSMRRKDREGRPRPVIQFSRSGCPILIEGLEGGYAWPRARDGRIYRDAPMEDGYFEHLQDCLQYTVGAIYLGGMAGDRITVVQPQWRFS